MSKELRVVSKNELSLLEEEHEALTRYAMGEKPCFSTGICTRTTAGYGCLDDFGYWQFPLPRKVVDYIMAPPILVLQDLMGDTDG